MSYYLFTIEQESFFEPQMTVDKVEDMYEASDKLALRVPGMESIVQDFQNELSKGTLVTPKEFNFLGVNALKYGIVVKLISDSGLEFPIEENSILITDGDSELRFLMKRDSITKDTISTLSSQLKDLTPPFIDLTDFDRVTKNYIDRSEYVDLEMYLQEPPVLYILEALNYQILVYE